MQRGKSISGRSTLRLPSSRGEVWTRMQPSGQAWAQVEQPVQRSSNQRRLVRALTGTGRISSGYLTVKGVRKRVRRVTIIPLAIPVPNKRAPYRRGRAVPARCCVACRANVTAGASLIARGCEGLHGEAGTCVAARTLLSGTLMRLLSAEPPGCKALTANSCDYRPTPRSPPIYLDAFATSTLLSRAASYPL